MPVMVMIFLLIISWEYSFGASVVQQPQKKEEKEIFRLSLLNKPPVEKVTMKRDIFTADILRSEIELNPKTAPAPEPPREPETTVIIERNPEEEVRRILFYEGFVLRRDQGYALITINGDSSMVTTGDTVNENIKIIKIEKKSITVESESKVFEIQLKGDTSNE